MITLEDLVEIQRDDQELARGREQKTLLAGMSKAGKSSLAATLAEVPWIEKVLVLDAEKSLGRMSRVLTQAEHRQKIVPIIPRDMPNVPATKLTRSQVGYPASAILLLNLLCNDPPKKLWIDQTTGKYSTSEVEDWFLYDPEEWENDRHGLIVDNFSLIAEGFLSLAYMTEGPDKPAFVYYNEAKKLINPIIQGVISSKMNIVFTTHVLLGSEEFTAKKVEWQDFSRKGDGIGKPKAISNQAELYPLVLTQAISRYFAGAFDNAVILHVKDTPTGREHAVGASSTYASLPFNCGSRFDVVGSKDTRMGDFYTGKSAPVTSKLKVGGRK